MELKIAQLLQNSRKDDLPPFSGRGNISQYSVQLGDFLWKRLTNHLPFDLCRLKIEILRRFSKFRIRFLKICRISRQQGKGLDKLPIYRGVLFLL